MNANIKEKLIHETKRMILYTLFLSLFFWTLDIYKRLILGQYAIDYVHGGYIIVESLILAKIILIGQMLNLGERFADKPLIIPTLFKTIVFTLFVFIFSILEHFITGFIKGKPASGLFQELLDHGLLAILAKVLIVFFMFVFFFAFQEIDKILGGKKLFNLFFKSRDERKI